MTSTVHLGLGALVTVLGARFRPRLEGRCVVLRLQNTKQNDCEVAVTTDLGIGAL